MTRLAAVGLSVFLGAPLTAVIVAGAGQNSPVIALPAEKGTLQILVDSAKAQGKTSVSYLALPADGDSQRPPFDQFLRDSVVFVATSQRRDAPLVVTTSQTMITWHLFHVERMLSAGGPSAACPIVPDSLSIGGRDIAVPVFGGTAIVDGVTVTLAGAGTGPTTLPAGERYLIAGARCEGSVVLGGGLLGIWRLDGDGMLIPREDQRGSLMESLRSVAAIESYLKQSTR